MNWLSMTVGAIFLICLIVGFMRGAVKIIVSLAATVVTLVLVWFATPYAADALAKYTPLDDMIKSQVVTTMANAASAQLGGEDQSGMDADSVRRVLNATGVSEETLAQYGVSIDDIVNGNVTSRTAFRVRKEPPWRISSPVRRSPEICRSLRSREPICRIFSRAC